MKPLNVRLKMKLRNIKCKSCGDRLEPFSDTIEFMRDNCQAGAACGLHRWNTSALPNSGHADTLPALLKAPVETTEPSEKITMTFSEPIYIHIKRRGHIRVLST